MTKPPPWSHTSTGRVSSGVVPSGRYTRTPNSPPEPATTLVGGRGHLLARRGGEGREPGAVLVGAQLCRRRPRQARDEVEEQLDFRLHRHGSPPSCLPERPLVPTVRTGASSHTTPRLAGERPRHRWEARPSTVMPPPVSHPWERKCPSSTPSTTSTAARRWSLKDLLGGKGANLAEMTSVLGLPVPPGLHDHHRRLPRLHARRLARRARRRDRQARRRSSRRRWAARSATPTTRCSVSVRSGAKFSMPGMMDTVLNLGPQRPSR